VLPKNNADFWREKLSGTVARDVANNRALAEAGWAAVTIWECTIERDMDEAMQPLLSLLK